MEENHGYTSLITSDFSLQFFLTAERSVLGTVTKPISILTGLIAIYFRYNIAYPKILYSVCIFLQHFVLEIVDKQRIPDLKE